MGSTRSQRYKYMTVHGTVSFFAILYNQYTNSLSYLVNEHLIREKGQSVRGHVSVLVVIKTAWGDSTVHAPSLRPLDAPHDIDIVRFYASRNKQALTFPILLMRSSGG